MFASIRHTAVAVAVATLGTVGFATAPAGAATIDAAAIGVEPHSAFVRHGDLDLASPAGVEALHQRIRVAVKSVCGNADTRDLAARQRIQACRGAALAGAQPKVDLAVATAQSGSQLAFRGGPSIHVAAH